MLVCMHARSCWPALPSPANALSHTPLVSQMWGTERLAINQTCDYKWSEGLERLTQIRLCHADASIAGEGASAWAPR